MAGVAAGGVRRPFADLMVATDAEVNRGSLAATAVRGRAPDAPAQPHRAVIGTSPDPALRAVGEYLRSHGAVVSAIYTSNVEQYPFRDCTSGASIMKTSPPCRSTR
jgi:hypothetical protein